MHLPCLPPRRHCRGLRQLNASIAVALGGCVAQNVEGVGGVVGSQTAINNAVDGFEGIGELGIGEVIGDFLRGVGGVGLAFEALEIHFPKDHGFFGVVDASFPRYIAREAEKFR